MTWVASRPAGIKEVCTPEHHTNVLIESLIVTLAFIACALCDDKALCCIFGMSTICERGVLDDEIIKNIASLVVKT